MEKVRKKLGLEVVEATHRRMKSIAAAHGIPLWAAVEDAFTSWLEKVTGKGGEEITERLQNLHSEDEKLVKLLNQIEQRDEMIAKSVRSLVLNLARIMGIENAAPSTTYADARAVTDRAIAGITKAIGAVEPSQEISGGGGGESVKPDQSPSLRRKQGA